MSGRPTDTRCETVISINGPGLAYTKSYTNDCFVLEEELPLLVYATPSQWMDGNYYTRRLPMDGVIRNLVFTNLETDTTIESACYVPPKCGSYAQDEEIDIENDKCVLDLGTFPDSFPDLWSFSFDLKIHSLPMEPTDPHWYFQILAGIDLFKSIRCNVRKLPEYNNGPDKTK